MNRITTEVLAAALGLKPQTLRAAICRNSHYFGIRPAKLPNGRLLWPADAVERLTSGKSIGDGSTPTKEGGAQ